MPAIRFQPAGADCACPDRGLRMSRPYGRRAFAVEGGAVILDSNSASVCADTSVTKGSCISL